MAVDTAVNFGIEFCQSSEDGLDRGVLLVGLSAEPSEVVSFWPWFSKERVNDFRFGGAIGRGQPAQLFDITIHVASIGAVQARAPVALGSKFKSSRFKVGRGH
jgi:hypothetical protein